MTTFYSSVAKAERIRCRPEDDDTFLLYNPRTDQLHLLDKSGKSIFDLCDGRSIDEVVREACALLGAPEVDAQHVLDFLCALKQRDLVVMN